MHVYEGAHYDRIADTLLISPSTARRIVSLFSVKGRCTSKGSATWA